MVKNAPSIFRFPRDEEETEKNVRNARLNFSLWGEIAKSTGQALVAKEGRGVYS